MAYLSYAIVDVFSTTPYKGNPLAVVDNTDISLTDTQMKLIARQFNLSETTFFSPPSQPNAAFRLRSFLPDGKEVFGAGHNILGQVSSVHEDGTEEFVFYQELGNDVSAINIWRKNGAQGRAEFTVSLRQAPPVSHSKHPDPSSLASSIGLASSDIGFEADGHTLHSQIMSTSTTRHLIVPVASIDALNKAIVQRDKLLQQLAVVDKAAYGLFLFTPVSSASGGETQIAYRARFFSPGMSTEDPATGSAAGPLSAYLYQHGHLPLVDGTASIEVRQGHSVGRECVIRVLLTKDASQDQEVLHVNLIGGGCLISEGRLVAPDVSTEF